MHFKRVANTINRPHFIAERDGDVILLNFCQDHKTMRCRTLDLPSEETADSMGGFGTSVFGFDDDRVSKRARVPKSAKPVDVKLSAHSKHGLGTDIDGKVYYLDDSPKTDTTNVWRVNCENGDNEYTMIPSGFITRFSDSDYFVVTNFRDSNKATICQWRTRANAEIIKTITIPNGMNDHTRLAYGSKIIWVKIEVDSINVHVLDVITEAAEKKNFALANTGDPTARWFCAKNNLLAVISGRLVFIGLQSLTCDNDPTNLEPNDKHHPFGVDSNGYIYVLSPTKDGCSVLRARDVTLSTEVETRVVIPKKEKNKVPRPLGKEDDKYINVHFHVTHNDRTLFDQTMPMLTTQTIGDIVRRSPEISQPEGTRLKIFYNDEEHLTFRTPNFLKMKDGDTIYAQFNDKEPLIDSKKAPASPKKETPGFFPPEMLEELEIIAPKKMDGQTDWPPKAQATKMTPVGNVRNAGHQERPSGCVPPQLRAAGTSERAECVQPNLREPKPQGRPSQSNGVAAPVRNVQKAAVVAVDPEQRLAEAAEAKATVQEKLLVEMQWLRQFVNGEHAKTAVRVPENYDMEKLQKKYARALMMMGRSEVQK